MTQHTHKKAINPYISDPSTPLTVPFFIIGMTVAIKIIKRRYIDYWATGQALGHRDNLLDDGIYMLHVLIN